MEGSCGSLTDGRSLRSGRTTWLETDLPERLALSAELSAAGGELIISEHIRQNVRVFLAGSMIPAALQASMRECFRRIHRPNDSAISPGTGRR